MDETKSPGRPGIDPARYVAQIQQWLNEGQALDAITATALQKAVGGQYRKASDKLDEFKAGYETRELSSLPEPPERLTNQLQAAALDIWRTLYDAQRQEVAAVSDEFDRARAQLEALAAERLACIDDLESQLSDRLQALQDAEQDLAARGSEVSQQREQLAELNERNRQLTERLAERGQELAATAQELTDTRAQLRDARTELDQQQRNGVELAGSLRDTRAELGQAQAECKRLRAAGTDQAAALASSQENLQALQRVLSDQDKALAVSAARLESCDEAAHAYKDEATQLQGERNALAVQLATAQTEAAQALEDKAQARAQVERLQGQLVELARQGGESKELTK